MERLGYCGKEDWTLLCGGGRQMKGSLSSILLLLRMRMPCRASRTGIKTSTPRSFVKLPSSRFTVTVNIRHSALVVTQDRQLPIAWRSCLSSPMPRFDSGYVFGTSKSEEFKSSWASGQNHHIRLRIGSISHALGTIFSSPSS
jgi:hypothetical protein